MSDIKLPFGLADILIDGQDVGSQGDAAVFSADPQYEEVESYENGKYDMYLKEWDVKLKVVFEEESYEKIKMAIPVLEEVEGGLTDGGVHKRIRDKAVEIRVHPRDEKDSKEFDVTIFKAYPVGVYERTYGLEVAKFEVEFIGLPVHGKSTEDGRYFFIGDYTPTP